MGETVSPGRLWYQAAEEHPGDKEARTARYLDLMREHGHIVEAKPGEDRNLPCGWPGTRATDQRSTEGSDGCP